MIIIYAVTFGHGVPFDAVLVYSQDFVTGIGFSSFLGTEICGAIQNTSCSFDFTQ